MQDIDMTAAAVNAAGISDAFRGMLCGDSESSGRFQELSDEHQGFIGVMTQIAEAGAHLERFRTRYGQSARWGDELPYIYDAWDAVARSIWNRLGATPVGEIVYEAMLGLIEAEAA